ncbi:hypothetical protein ACROYT_G005993 [Oculina patagonica]
MWKKRYINSSTSHSVPKDVPGSSSSESEDGNLDLSLGPATCLHAQDLSGSDSGPSVHWLLHEQEESDSLSDEDSSHHEDGGTDYVDSDLSDVEELLHSEDVKLLQPLPPRTPVDELNALWKGVKVNTYRSPSTAVEIHAAVLCFASYIPAARKLYGFLGHSAKRGCSHCYKIFPGSFGEQKNYSGFDDRDQENLA